MPMSVLAAVMVSRELFRILSFLFFVNGRFNSNFATLSGISKRNTMHAQD